MLYLYIALIILGVLILAYITVGGIVVSKIFCPRKRDNDMLIKYEEKEKRFDRKWLEEPFEEMRRTSQYGYELYARLYRPDVPSDKFVILLHGHNSSSIGQLKYMHIFKHLEYNVFIPDHRRSGLSGGKCITFGCYEKHDVEDWVDVLAKRFPNATFGIFGESMGAATATMVTEMDHRIRFLIEYCGFASFEDFAVPHLKYRWLYKIMEPSFKLMAGALYNVDLNEANAYAAMKKITVPVMIIHSKDDKLVYVSNAYKFRDARPDARFELFENAPHARSWVLYPERYETIIREFVKDAEKKYAK